MVVDKLNMMIHHKKMNFNEKEYKEFLIKLGDNIRKKRSEKNLSQENLAFNIDSARNFIGCIERSEKALSLKTLYKIAKALDVPVEELFKGTM